MVEHKKENEIIKKSGSMIALFLLVSLCNASAKNLTLLFLEIHLYAVMLKYKRKLISINYY